MTGILISPFSTAAFAQNDYDLVVDGGTAGGVMTAVSAAREGLNVVLLEPGHHVGGMATGGLSRTDFGKKEVTDGYALEFYWRLGGNMTFPDLRRRSPGITSRTWARE